MQSLKLVEQNDLEVIQRKEFKGGIFELSNKMYHAGPGISRSGIMTFKKSPLHYWHRYINPKREPSLSTEAMEFGTMFHMFVLEPELFEETYFVSMKCPHHGATKLAKEYKANEELKAKGKKIISDVDMKRIKDMTDGLYGHPKAFKLISGAQYEKSIYWVDQGSGLLCKSRPDIWHNDFIVDLKTTKDASKRKFSFDFQDSGNYIQCAMIRDGILANTGKKIDLFMNLAVEKDAPFAPAHYPVSTQYVDLGEQEYKHYLKEIKKCMEKNEWLGYQDDQIDVPNYLLSEWTA